MTRQRLPSWITDPFIVNCDTGATSWDPMFLISQVDRNLYQRHRHNVRTTVKDLNKKVK